MASLILGLSVLHLACLEGDSPAVCSLIGIDNYDQNEPTEITGDTPLMLAAIMGHSKTVKCLLKFKADQNIRNKLGYTVHDLLVDSNYVQEKTYKYLGSNTLPEELPRLRMEILHLLESQQNTGPDLFVIREGGELRLLRQVEPVIQTGYSLTETKTAGFIQVGRESILKFACSGYDPALSKTQSRSPSVLDTKTWNGIARDIMAPAMGFQFTKHYNDNGSQRPEPEHFGRFLAGHVEVLLSTWYVLVLGTKGVGEQATIQERIEFLREAKLGSKRQPQLYITADPCSHCKKYLATIFQHTGILFKVKKWHNLSRQEKTNASLRMNDFVGDMQQDQERRNVRANTTLEWDQTPTPRSTASSTPNSTNSSEDEYRGTPRSASSFQISSRLIGTPAYRLVGPPPRTASSSSSTEDSEPRSLL